MKTERKIFIAFVLNLAFSVLEFIGGAITASVAIMSDAVHDLGDAMSIGISYFLEKKSKKQPDKTYTYGYARFSVMGSVITTVILLVGSVVVIYNAVLRIIEPVEINYSGMIIFALVGVSVNCLAVLFTSGGHSLNQRAVNLHMLEDVLGWVVVLVGAVVMRFTNFALIDPLMSIGVAAFILINALENLKEVLDLFLAKIPQGIEIEDIEEHICEIEGVKSIHHIHVWSMDGHSNYATMHIVADGDTHTLKEKIREELREHGIGHATLEFEAEGEYCHEESCRVEIDDSEEGHHHHHHHHHHSHNHSHGHHH